MRVLIFLSLLFVFGITYAQKDNSAFQKNFSAKFKYPRTLWDQGVPTFSNLKIEISKNGSIKNIEISDSAPVLFREKFDEIKSKLNTDLLKPVVITHRLKDCNIIIPIFYTCQIDSGNPPERVKQVFSNYYLFNGKPLDKLSYNLEPIAIFLYKPRE
ncbi:hypothetical protein HK413_11695 [Mucilaginibacter sp. S1162]|uniref:TonB C-terminal domain-containing protein n=1 Tax=Mucilaginibacter humi TaxID=2732510 RepID=A0ABX1W5J7_9SPHI|nr:hypothetical protein [Mucilaginibacter humi]NNU34579.1 hypothetical protein [Mucilaginibacter humi]